MYQFPLLEVQRGVEKLPAFRSVKTSPGNSHSHHLPEAKIKRQGAVFMGVVGPEQLKAITC